MDIKEKCHGKDVGKNSLIGVTFRHYLDGLMGILYTSEKSSMVFLMEI